MTLAVDGKICSHMETGLNHDIAAGRVSTAPTRENYYTAGALKESDVDYVFNNVGFSSTSELYSLHISDAVRERAEQALAERNAAADSEKELPPSLDTAVQPVVTIIWSESDKLQEGEQLPLARADALFKALDEEKRTDREKPGYTGGWYDKTKFRIDCIFDGERDSYEGRQDFGDGDGSLNDHIEAYHEYYANDESWQNYVLHNHGAESWEQDKAEREMILSEFVPYMRLHCNLSEQERTAVDVLENGENLTPEQTAYFTAVLAHVDTCREKLNAGDYDLPDPPQFADFAQETAEMEAYKDHVREEIAQEAAAAGMGGISADDPQAVAKLEAKLSKLEEAQETMKAVNAYYRKHKTLDGCPHLTPEQIDKLKADMAQSWHLDKSRPYQSFVLSNNNAEIRRIRARIEQVRQHEDTQFAGWEFDGGRVEANKADNRLQIFFDGKPDEGTRDELKANGFRWAPSVGAWQRQLNMNAYRAAGHISCIQPVTGDKPVDLQRNAQHQQEAATPDTFMTGERITTPRGSFHVTGMTREQMEAAGYGYHHSSEDGKYLIMGNGTQAYAIAAEQRVPENYMRTAELTTEQNYNMIDGRINNTPSVDELEEKAKRGEVISLSALAAAVKAEDGRTPQRSVDGKKTSIRAQLKADRAQAAAKPKQKEKEQEARRSVRQALEME